MGKKKAIDCPEVLGGYGRICVKVGRPLGYPKRSQETRPINAGKSTEREVGGYEYRYVCPNCGSEWLQDTLHNQIEQIKSPSVKIELRDGEEIYIPQEDYMLDYFGLEHGKIHELTKDDIKDIRRRKEV